MTRHTGARNARTSEVVAESIRARIASGELKAGDRFPTEDELMAVFGIARATLREALRILETEGLVTVLRGRHGGPQVTSPSLDPLARMFALHLQMGGVSARDLHAAREIVEQPLVAAFTRTRSAPALAELHTAVEAAAAAAEAGDGPGFGRASGALYSAVTTQSPNRSLGVLARLLHQVAACCQQTAGRPLDAPEQRHAVGYYRRFHQLAEAGDVAGACAHWQPWMIHTGSTSPSRTADRELPVTRCGATHGPVATGCR
ncbi:FadR/GntR family transcriptional regulator [Parafrankia elaeagni]|uniref:FadR/GntR family transcriptional regulator n=1 Tax=Parafrankia elaeagni TaxID=222534 RepID=UPI000371D18F|nr:GntR family transcriptional regulator [Parafrankia elaeagni]